MSFPEQQHDTPYRLDDPTSPPTPAAPPRTRRKWPFVVAVTVVALLLAGGGTAYYLTSRPKAADPLSTENLITACRDAAKRQLKSPASAQFSDETTSQIAENRMRVWGVVDAQNGFGAQLRNRYTCEADRGERSWIVQSVLFSDWN